MISMKMSLNLLLKFSGNVTEVVSKSVHEIYPGIIHKLSMCHARTASALGQDWSIVVVWCTIPNWTILDDFQPLSWVKPTALAALLVGLAGAESARALTFSCRFGDSIPGSGSLDRPALRTLYLSSNPAINSSLPTAQPISPLSWLTLPGCSKHLFSSGTRLDICQIIALISENFVKSQHANTKNR